MNNISDIIQKQREFFALGSSRSYKFRINALKKLQSAIKENSDVLTAAMKQDLNKHPLEGYMCEVGIVLDEIRYHIRHLKNWMREKNVSTPLSQFPARSFVSPEPYGVVLIMSPWNYPVNLCLDPLIGAISGGNCAVLKPSIYAPATSHAIAEIIGKIFPLEYITVIEGGRSENSALFDEKFDYIFFTGSVAVGKAAMAAAARNLTPITLELGGKSPVIVDRTANIAMAARRVAFGKVLNAGQTCIEPDYLLIEDCVRDEFIGEFKNALDMFFPDGDMSDMAVIISEKHYNNKKKLLEGQTAAIGGRFDDSRRFIEPTVLIDVDPASPIMEEEIFAPILPVITWKNLNEAIEFVVSRPKPLALYLFTRDTATERAVLNRCSFGGGCINDTIIHLVTQKMGFGGVGNSGMGAYHGKFSFDTFTHYRGIVKKSNLIDLKMRYFPYTAKNLKLIKKFLR